MSDADYRKALGYQPESTGETTPQYIERVVGMMTLYTAILQTPVAPDSSSSIPYPFQFTRIWAWLARMLNNDVLLRDRAAPQLIFAVIETAGDSLQIAYGKQISKLRRGLGKRCLLEGEAGEVVGGKEGKAPRMRLGLMLDKWEKEGKVGGVGRDVGA
jgi:nucleoporin GLE1